MPEWASLTALAAIALVSRLPQLLSPNLLVDGDESIFGLMAKHLSEGREFPIFFYGQTYGLSIVEVPAAAIAFLIAGVGALPLKLAMLAIWAVGIGFYFLAFARVLGSRRSFWITAVLVLMPAWAVTSMKAWSGYTTAFSATGLALYLLTPDGTRRSARWLLLGALTSLIYFSQPTWLPGLLPVVLYFLLSSRRASCWLLYLSGMAGVIASIAAVRAWWLAGAVESWRRPTAGNPNLLGSLPDLVRQAYVNFTGSWFLASTVPSGPVTAVVACLWLGLLLATALVQVYRLIARQYLLWSHLLCVSVWSTVLATWVLLEARDARYLLAMNAPLVFLAGIELFDAARRYRLPDRRWLTAIVLVLALEAVSMNEFARFTYMWWTNDRNSPSEAKTLDKVIGYMRSRGAAHAFSMNPLLQWEITFHSRESVIARWTANVDRYPAYITDVDRALDAGEPVAIVGYVGYSGGLETMVANPQEIVQIDRKYFVYMRPDKALLRKLGFRFAN